MSFISEDGKLFGLFNVLDAGITALLGLIVLGVVLVQSNMHATSSAMVEGETDIDIRVMFRLRSEKAPLFKAGEMTNITIRNQPRGAVKIISAEMLPVEETQIINGKAQAVEDLSEYHVNDYWVTLRDHATITKEGYVAEGVKVKIGLPINLEGFDYYAHGGIVDVKPVAQQPADERSADERSKG